MKKLLLGLLVTFPLACLSPAQAQLFNRKPKTPAPQRVAELIVQARTDADERKRAAAAEELRDFDAKTYSEIVPVLVDLARSDPKASVRLEAISSLAKIRPVSQSAGQTLEWAAGNDESWKVRWQAKSSLVGYKWSGYQAGKNEPATSLPKPPPMSQEPPLIDPRASVDPNVERAPASPGAANRFPPLKLFGQPSAAKAKGQPAPPPSFATQPPPKIAVPAAPKSKVVQTPPPIIVDVPDTTIEPANDLPPIPPLPGNVIEPAPKVSAPPAAPGPNVTEPNFRPAGQTPPRLSPSTPPPPRNAPPPPKKNDDSGPALTSPM